MSAVSRVLVILNPVAGRRSGRRFGSVCEALSAMGARVDLRETTAPGDAEAFARQASGQGYDVIVAAGGDGTIGEVVNGLPADAPPLGIVPLGTANVFASEIGLGSDARKIARTILGGDVRQVYAGLANGRRFLVMAGAGLDAEVVAAVTPALKRCWGKFAYVIETWRQAFRYGFPKIDIEADGQKISAATAVACKGRHYGGPHLFALGADVARPDFELVWFEKGGAPRIFLYGIALGLGYLPRMPGVRRMRARAIVMTGVADAPVQGDGDVIARLPVTLMIDPQPVAVLYPPRKD